MDNHIVLTACIAQTKPLRYTPAGLPALDLLLDHQSRQTDAGQEREVKLTLKAVAFGAMAETLTRQPLGSAWRLSGFLAAPRNGKSVVFHIQHVQHI